MYGTVTFSVVIAVVLFLMVPYFLSELLHKAGAGTTLTAVAEAFVRVALFLGYLAAISRMEDIQRVFMYHGAEHKCINCVEHGLELNVENVLKSSWSTSAAERALCTSSSSASSFSCSSGSIPRC